MEECLADVQVTPPTEDNAAFAQHILWAPKKKRLHRRMIRDVPSGARRGSKIRKRLIFPIEENERKEEEELSSDVSEYMKEVNNGKKDSLRTPDCSEDKRNGSGVKLDLLKVRADHLKASQKLTRNVDPQRIKRKLALSSFRWKNCDIHHSSFEKPLILWFGGSWTACFLEAMQLHLTIEYQRSKSVLNYWMTVLYWFMWNFRCSKQLSSTNSEFVTIYVSRTCTLHCNNFNCRINLLITRIIRNFACRICDTSSKLDLHFGNAMIGSLKFNLLLSKAALEKMRYQYTFKSQIKYVSSKNKEKWRRE